MTTLQSHPRHMLAEGVKVHFVSPDMNWDDVRNVLMHGVARSEDKWGVAADCTVVLIDEVRAYTDTTNISVTAFILSGLAKVGLSASAMGVLFLSARLLCQRYGIVADPYVWPLLDLSQVTSQAKLAKRMLDISADTQMTEAFLQDQPYDAVVHERVTIRYSK